MYRLYYVSTASKGLNDEAYEEILKTSRSHNQSQNVTGALLFNGVNFAQILEGEKEDVLQTLDKIKKDKRHSGLIVIGEKQVSFRFFADWAMKKVDGLDFKYLQQAMDAD